MVRSPRWWLVVVVLPGAVVAVVAAATIALSGRLPDPLAVHWGFDGAPNGTMPAGASHAFLIGSMLAAWGILVVTSIRGRVHSPVAAIVYFVVALLALVQLQILLANLDAPVWEGADELPWVIALGIAVSAAGAGLAGWFVAGGRAAMPQAPPLAPGELPIVDVAPGDPLSWEGSASNGWLLLLAMVVAALGLLIPPPWSLLLVLVALVVAHFTTVSVRVDTERVVVGVGFVRIPSSRYRLVEIARAEAFELAPLSYGGWGYRVVRGARAFVIRGGPAIRLVREQQHDLVITVDDAVAGAGTINAALRSRGLLRLPE